MFCRQHQLEFVYDYPANFGCPKCRVWHPLNSILKWKLAEDQSGVSRNGDAEDHALREMCLRILQDLTPEWRVAFAWRLINEPHGNA